MYKRQVALLDATLALDFVTSGDLVSSSTTGLGFGLGLALGGSAIFFGPLTTGAGQVALRMHGSSACSEVLDFCFEVKQIGCLCFLIGVGEACDCLGFFFRGEVTGEVLEGDFDLGEELAKVTVLETNLTLSRFLFGEVWGAADFAPIGDFGGSVPVISASLSNSPSDDDSERPRSSLTSKTFGGLITLGGGVDCLSGVDSSELKDLVFLVGVLEGLVSDPSVSIELSMNSTDL